MITQPSQASFIYDNSEISPSSSGLHRSRYPSGQASPKTTLPMLASPSSNLEIGGLVSPQAVAELANSRAFELQP